MFEQRPGLSGSSIVVAEEDRGDVVRAELGHPSTAHATTPLGGTLVESRIGAVARDAFRFPSPLIEPDVPVASIRLSDRIHQLAHGRAPWGVTRRLTPSGPKMA